MTAAIINCSASSYITIRATDRDLLPIRSITFIDFAARLAYGMRYLRLCNEWVNVPTVLARLRSLYERAHWLRHIRPVSQIPEFEVSP